MTNQSLRFLRPLAVSRPRLTFAALLLGVLAPRAASAVQGAELYRTQSQFYGRFEARVRYAPGEGVVSSFFLWKEGSSSTTSWNELDHEKINGPCRLQTNIWTGTGTQDHQINTPAFDICGDYHTYGIEWTPDYVAWFIDGAQIRRVTGASVTEYTRNASQGMAIHFNVWPGDANFGGTFNASILPVRQYISWVQYSSYANGAFQQQWREEFNGSTMPSGWAAGDWPSPFNNSRHNPANVSFVNGIAVLSLTADNATGFSGTPPADTSGGGGAPGTGGAGGTGTGGAGTGGAGRGGAGGTAGGGGRGGAGGSGSPGTAGTSSTGRGGSGTGGAAGNGAGGMAAGTAGSGAGGMAAGTAGSGAGGAASGTAGSGTGGVASGTAGSGTGGGPLGRGGASATGGGGAAATGGASGTGGTPSGDDGCGCRVAGDGLTGGSIALLLIAACARRRRPPIVRRRPPQA